MSNPGEKLFVRNATGLVRDIGLFTAMLITICHVIGLGWQKRVFQVAGWAPVKAENYFLGIHPMVMAFLLGGILIILTVYCFAVLSAAMPRSGGGYVFISRIINPGFGFIAGWLAVMSTAVSYGLIAVASFEVLLIFGGVTGVNLPAPLATPMGLFLSGVVVIVIFSAIASLGVKQWGPFLATIFAIPAVILILVYVIFLIADQSVMEAGVKGLFQGKAPVDYTKAAIAQGLKENPGGYWGAVATAMIASIWAYGGYAAGASVAGEVKEGARNVPRSLFYAGLVIVAIYMSISALLARAGGMVGLEGGWNFADAVAFMNSGGGSFKDANLPAVGGWMTVFAAIAAKGVGLDWALPLLAIFALLWVANDIPPFIIVTSRVIFAMAFDRLLPERFAEINERYHSPVNAVVFVSLVAVLGAAAEADVFAKVGGPLHAIINPGGLLTATDLWSAVFEFGVALAAFMFPLRMPEVFANSPFKASAGLVRGVAGLAVIGQLYLIWIFLTDPNGSYNVFGIKDFTTASALLFSVLVGVIGWVVYAIYSSRGKSTGVNYNTIFAQIPPE